MRCYGKVNFCFILYILIVYSTVVSYCDCSIRKFRIRIIKIYFHFLLFIFLVGFVFYLFGCFALVADFVGLVTLYLFMFSSTMCNAFFFQQRRSTTIWLLLDKDGWFSSYKPLFEVPSLLLYV